MSQSAFPLPTTSSYSMTGYPIYNENHHTDHNYVFLTITSTIYAFRLSYIFYGANSAALL